MIFTINDVSLQGNTAFLILTTAIPMSLKTLIVNMYIVVHMYTWYIPETGATAVYYYVNTGDRPTQEVIILIL